MATKESCAKGCGRQLKRGPGKAAHERHCNGVPKDGGDGSVEENPDMPARPKKSTRKAKASRRIPKKVGPIDNALDLLYAKRDELIRNNPELDSVMNAISALEELRS